MNCMRCKRPASLGAVNNTGSQFFCLTCFEAVGAPKDDPTGPNPNLEETPIGQDYRLRVTIQQYSKSELGEQVVERRPIARQLMVMDCFVSQLQLLDTATNGPWSGEEGA